MNFDATICDFKPALDKIKFRIPKDYILQPSHVWCLKKLFGRGNRRKMKGIAEVRLSDSAVKRAEIQCLPDEEAERNAEIRVIDEN